MSIVPLQTSLYFGFRDTCLESDYISTQLKGLFTPSESEKHQRTIGRDQKIKRQTSKKNSLSRGVGRP